MRDETLYSSKRLRLPAPHFLVFYNGKEEREERSILKLSDSFEYAGTQKEEPNLELKVLVLNINQGNNKDEYYGSNVPLFRRNGYRQSGTMIP